MKISNIYLVAAFALLLLCIGLVSKSNSITGAAIGSSNSYAPILFTMGIAVVFLGLFLIRKIEVSKHGKN